MTVLMQRECVRPMSPAQRRVACCLGRGHTVQGVARELHVSLSTVKHHIEGAVVRLPPSFLPHANQMRRLALYAAIYFVEVRE